MSSYLGQVDENFIDKAISGSTTFTHWHYFWVRPNISVELRQWGLSWRLWRRLVSIPGPSQQCSVVPGIVSRIYSALYSGPDTARTTGPGLSNRKAILGPFSSVSRGQFSRH